MRSALFLSALLATALFGGTALAERTSDDSSSRRVSSAQDLKERVLHERGENRTTEHSSTRTEHTSSKAEKFRSKGDSYEQYGHRSGGSAVSTSASHSSSSKMMAAKLLPGRSHGDVVDGQSKGSRTTSGATLSSSPGAKNVKSFVHQVNDKGEVNNNIHGSTASAMKMRHVANILMKTAVRDPHVKVFSWTTAGGDGQSLFPGN